MIHLLFFSLRKKETPVISRFHFQKDFNCVLQNLLACCLSTKSNKAFYFMHIHKIKIKKRFLQHSVHSSENPTLLLSSCKITRRPHRAFFLEVTYVLHLVLCLCPKRIWTLLGPSPALVLQLLLPIQHPPAQRAQFIRAALLWLHLMDPHRMVLWPEESGCLGYHDNCSAARLSCLISHTQ